MTVTSKPPLARQLQKVASHAAAVAVAYQIFWLLLLWLATGPTGSLQSWLLPATSEFSLLALSGALQAAFLAAVNVVLWDRLASVLFVLAFAGSWYAAVVHGSEVSPVTLAAIEVPVVIVALLAGKAARKVLSVAMGSGAKWAFFLETARRAALLFLLLCAAVDHANRIEANVFLWKCGLGGLRSEAAGFRRAANLLGPLGPTLFTDDPEFLALLFLLPVVWVLFWLVIASSPSRLGPQSMIAAFILFFVIWLRVSAPCPFPKPGYQYWRWEVVGCGANSAASLTLNGLAPPSAVKDSKWAVLYAGGGIWGIFWAWALAIATGQRQSSRGESLP